MKKFNTLLRKSAKKSDPDDAEFEREVQQLHQVTEKTRKVYKDMKQAIKAEADLASAQSKLSSELRNRSSIRTEPLKTPVEGFCSVLDEVTGGNNFSAELQSNQERMFVEPLKRFYKSMNQIDQGVQRREQKKLEYEKALAKLERLERSSAGASKSEAARRDLNTAKLEYAKIHQQMMEEVPQLCRGRIEYFAPCLEASMEAEMLYHMNAGAAFENHLARLEPLPDDDDEIQAQTEEILAKIKAIQIVGHDPSSV